MRSLRVAVLGVVVAVALAGCSPLESNQSGRPGTTPSATSTAEPGQQRETGFTQPAIVFGAQCDQLFSDAELASIAGVVLTLSPNHFSEAWGGDALFNQNGGFECTWIGDNARVIALVLPEAAAVYTSQESPCSDEARAEGYGEFSCGLEAVVNGIRLSGLSEIGQNQSEATTARGALLALFSDKAAQQQSVPVPIPAAGSWVLPPDCATVAETADFSAIPGLGAGATASEGGYGKAISQAESVLAPNWFTKSCFLEGDSAILEFVPVGGARWREAAIAARADATALALDGVESAYSVPYTTQGGESRTLIYAFSGPNMLMFTVRYTKNAGGIATAFFAALDATAVT